MAVNAQNAKKFFKVGTEVYENGKYTDAIDQFSKAILEPILTMKRHMRTRQGLMRSSKNLARLLRTMKNWPFSIRKMKIIFTAVP